MDFGCYLASVPVLDPARVLGVEGNLALERGDVHLWAFSLADDGKPSEWCRQCLSNEEIDRAKRIVHAAHRSAFVLARGLMRHVISRYVGISPAGVSFETGPYGKPTLAEFSEHLSFSLAHSHDRAVLAIGDGSELGVDVEQERPDVDALGIAEAYFSQGEREVIWSASAGRARSEFFRYWVAKEAVLKGEGLGLSFPLDRFEVLFSADGSRGRVRSMDTERLHGDWTIRLLSLGRGWPMAISARGECWRVTVAIGQ